MGTRLDALMHLPARPDSILVLYCIAPKNDG